MVIKKEVVNFFKIFSEKLSRLVGLRNFSFIKALTPIRLIEIVYILLFFLFTGGIVNSYLEGSDPVFFFKIDSSWTKGSKSLGIFNLFICWFYRNWLNLPYVCE